MRRNKYILLKLYNYLDILSLLGNPFPIWPLNPYTRYPYFDKSDCSGTISTSKSTYETALQLNRPDVRICGPRGKIFSGAKSKSTIFLLIFEYIFYAFPLFGPLNRGPSASCPLPLSASLHLKGEPSILPTNFQKGPGRMIIFRSMNTASIMPAHSNKCQQLLAVSVRSRTINSIEKPMIHLWTGPMLPKISKLIKRTTFY